MVRRVIEIDREKCNGCGACADACQEGAIGMVDGKANVHVFFPTTPMLSAYSRINYRGTMEKLQYYKKVVGAPSMVFLPDGSVRVTGAVHYDPTVKPKTVPDAADVPGM